MKRLDRFILTSFIGPFFAILLIVIFILMMQFLWVYIDELVGKGLGLGVVLEFMLLGGCTILPLALPLATLLSAMMVMGMIGDNNELMNEINDLLYHVMVLCANQGLDWADVEKVLDERNEKIGNLKKFHEVDKNT